MHFILISKFEYVIVKHMKGFATSNIIVAKKRYPTFGMLETISYSTDKDVRLLMCPIFLLILSVSEWRL